MRTRTREKPVSGRSSQGRTGLRLTMDHVNIALLCVLIVVSVSCSVKPEVVRQPTALGFIPFPKPPERVEIEVPGQPKKPGVHYVEPPLVLKPNQMFRAYSDGAVVWKPKDWLGINHIVTQWPLWADSMKDVIDILNRHNESLKPKPEAKKWYEPKP